MTNKPDNIKGEKKLKKTLKFIGDKPFVSSGFFDTARGKEFQITFHELSEKPSRLWQRLRFCFMILTR